MLSECRATAHSSNHLSPVSVRHISLTLPATFRGRNNASADHEYQLSNLYAISGMRPLWQASAELCLWPLSPRCSHVLLPPPPTAPGLSVPSLQPGLPFPVRWNLEKGQMHVWQLTMDHVWVSGAEGRSGDTHHIQSSAGCPVPASPHLTLLTACMCPAGTQPPPLTRPVWACGFSAQPGNG